MNISYDNPEYLGWLTDIEDITKHLIKHKYHDIEFVTGGKTVIRAFVSKT